MSTTIDPGAVEARTGLRRPTAQEQQTMRQWFPRLDFNSVYVRGEQTAAYNCLAWTLGITNRWVWPWPPAQRVTKADFDVLYRKSGFAPAKTGSVAAMGLSSGDMKHGVLGTRGLVSMPRWSSKLGQYLLIQHELGQLEGGHVYGNVQGYYSNVQALGAAGGADEEPVGEVPAPDDAIVRSSLSDDELQFLQARAEAVDPDLRGRFETAYEAWRRTWSHPAIALSSDPSEYARSIEFLELVGLGAEIVPLLMLKLIEPDGFFALQALERLGRPQLLEATVLDEEAILGGEQERARQAIERFIALEA